MITILSTKNGKAVHKISLFEIWSSMKKLLRRNTFLVTGFPLGSFTVVHSSATNTVVVDCAIGAVVVDCAIGAVVVDSVIIESAFTDKVLVFLGLLILFNCLLVFVFKKLSYNVIS